MAVIRRWACIALMLALAAPVMADWRAALPGAQRVGSGEFTWFGLRLYTARLWASGPVGDWQQPFALELLYHRDLSRDTLVQASLEEMQRMGAAPSALEDWRKAMQSAFVDVRPGMRITGLYLPGQGCRFYVDGVMRREIADPVFARAFFAIWLDERARDPKLRQRLLGLAGNQ
jgi:hypothetical protein